MLHKTLFVSKTCFFAQFGHVTGHTLLNEQVHSYITSKIAVELVHIGCQKSVKADIEEHWLFSNNLKKKKHGQ